MCPGNLLGWTCGHPVTSFVHDGIFHANPGHFLCLLPQYRLNNPRLICGVSVEDVRVVWCVLV